LAQAYKRLVEIAELEQRRELGKVTSMTDALLQREEVEYGGHVPKPPTRPRFG